MLISISLIIWTNDHEAVYIDLSLNFRHSTCKLFTRNGFSVQPSKLAAELEIIWIRDGTATVPPLQKSLN